MIIAVGAIFVAFLKFFSVFPEGLFALFAGKGHFRLLEKRVAFLFGMAFGAVKPFSTARRSDRDLRVEDVFAHDGWLLE